MRLWSLHPSYLDSKGLVALWREALLAKAVLEGKTIGYKNHPQLDRFKSTSDPVMAVSYYLKEVYDESIIRGFRFDPSKIIALNDLPVEIPVSRGQIEYEANLLLHKLKKRSTKDCLRLLNRRVGYRSHPMFRIDLSRKKPEAWEKVRTCIPI